MQMYKEWKLAVDHVVVASTAIVEPIEEDKEKEDKELYMEGDSSTEDLAPQQAPAMGNHACGAWILGVGPK